VSAVLAITGPIFALIGTGWLVTRAGLFSVADVAPSGATSLCSPCLR